MNETEEKTGSVYALSGDHDGQIGGWLSRLPYIPFFFLGLGIYRAWIEIVFVGSFISFPFEAIDGQNVFDLTLIIFLALGACFARRIRSLLPRRCAYVVCGMFLTVSTILMFTTLYFPQYSVLFGFPAAIMSGIGIAIIILMWSEIYGSLNPMRVALYYSASIMFAALIIYLCMGMNTPTILFIALLLPLFSLLCVVLAHNKLPVNEKNIFPISWFSFPWKPTLLMAVYGIAFGLKEIGLYDSFFGPHSSVGVVVVAAVVFAGVLLQGPKFDFALIYRIGLPLMVCGFLLLPSFGFIDGTLSDLCVSASYGAFSILTMLILANMSYRYGISALWLFGIERSIRALSTFVGRQLYLHIDIFSFSGIEPTVVIAILVILLVIVMSMILFSEKDLSSRWGVVFLGEEDSVENEMIIKKQNLANKCMEIAKEYWLTQREEEVLLLLAQKKTISSIERELFIANGTAKAHVRHIYRKLDIHSREELFDLLGL